MKHDLTDITLVLDRSGSMQIIRSDVTGGINRFIEDQRKQPGAANFTLIQFDADYEVVRQTESIATTKLLAYEDFMPRDRTALYDAMGRAIYETGARLGAIPECDRPGKVLFVVLTDGQNNHSREFTKDKIAEMTKHQTEQYGWEFVYLGANQDAFEVGASVGVVACNSLNYTADPNGTKIGLQTLSASTAAYRSGNTSGAFFADATTKKS